MSKKTKITISVLVCIIIVALAAIIPVLILKTNKNSKLTTPSKPTIVQSENFIAIETSNVENAVKYIYEITIPRQTQRILTFESTKNTLSFDFLNDSSLKNEFAYAGIYSVCVYAASTNKNNNSYKSLPATFERTFKLNTPQIFKNELFLQWDNVGRADYYELYVSSTNASKVKTLNKTTTQISIADLKEELQLECDYYTFCLKAFSNNQYLLESNSSNILEFYINE